MKLRVYAPYWYRVKICVGNCECEEEDEEDTEQLFS